MGKKRVENVWRATHLHHKAMYIPIVASAGLEPASPD